MTPKNWTLEGKNRTLGGGVKMTPKIGRHLWMFPNTSQNIPSSTLNLLPAQKDK